ncbi:uncharacterized protein LOC129216638 [Uloborus diversus]|uniref:uncharacterized protein LOC129216638 n=1 Tax=Uloborus diversus TaxID=327109 RepID=UPI00240A6561|nr:uncharacterized protein LOC129216638 [Uloborus diversus]
MMPQDQTQPQTVISAMEANKVSVKIPPFWVEKPEMWFFTVEAQNKISGISSEETRFNYLVAQLEPKFIENIWDIIKDDTANKYTAAKERLLSTFKESETKRIQQLVNGLELGDMKPSQLLRRMRSLGDAEDISDKVLRTLWLEKMPDRIKNILIVSEESTEKLAAMADRIAEMTPSCELAKIEAPTPPPYETLLAKISSLEYQIASLSLLARHRSPHRSQNNGRRSRSRSKRRFDPNGKFCFYHYRFGKQCRPEKCKPPCNWKQSEN